MGRLAGFEVADAPAEMPKQLWRVTGRGLRPTESAAPEHPNANPPKRCADTDVERISRYNFDELSRILTDRVGGENARAETSNLPKNTPGLDSLPPPARPAGALVNLSDETLILNRLPLGLVVYRGHQVLFANRAMAELTGYSSIEEFRSVGLSGVLPSADAMDGRPGPVTRLVARDGMTVPVVARLQSITWQGNPAMLLSARAADAPANNEAAVRSFAELFASTRAEGFFEVSRAGIIEAISGKASHILGRLPDVLIGRPLVMLIDAGETRRPAGISRPAGAFCRNGAPERCAGRERTPMSKSCCSRKAGRAL